MAYNPTVWARGDVVSSGRLNHIENGIVDAHNGVAVVNGKIDQKVEELEAMIGSPLVASTVSDMVDEDRVYVYVGSEAGYTNGNWYYFDGEAWTSGGVYNSTAFVTDQTLTVAGMAADAKATGDQVSAIKEDLSEYENIFTGDVDESVQNWLNEHPEATTSVQDWSLTANKLVKGTLGFVTFEMFGAVGDGVTDDTQAISDAIDYAVNNNTAICILEKTYILNSAVITKYLSGGQSLCMYGFGEKSVIKRKPDSLVHAYSTLLVVRLADDMTAPACDVSFLNFKIDSNRREQSMATEDYTYEASADIMFLTGANSPETRYINRVIVDRMMFYDGVADNLSFSGSTGCNVQNVFISNIVAQKRDGTRNDIGITGNPLGDVYITNCFCGSMHFEFNSAVQNDDLRTFIVNGFDCDQFTISGNVKMIANNIICRKMFILGGLYESRFTNCRIILHPSYYSYIINSDDVIFTDCDFVSKLNADGNACTSLTLRASKTKFYNCRFAYDGELLIDTDSDSVAGRIDGSPIAFFYTTSATDTVTLFDACEIDEKFDKGVICKNAGTVTVKNITLQNRYPFLLETSLANCAMNVYLSNVKLGTKAKYTFDVHTFTTTSTVLIEGDLSVLESCLEVHFDTTSARNGFFARTTQNLKRTCALSNPLTQAYLYALLRQTTNTKYIYLFKGDTLVYDGANPILYPDRWVVMDNGLTTTTSSSDHADGQLPLIDRIKSEGSATGATANRPNCYLIKGFVYYDTDLGKPIYWNGTGWVDSAGVAVV